MGTASLTDRFLDFLDLLRWPLIVAGFLGFFFWRYRENVARLIDRIQSVSGPFGTAAEFGAPPEQELFDEEAALGLFDEEPIESVRVEYETRLALEQMQHEDTLQQLQQQLAAAELRGDFEFAYGQIWGSQIAALRTMQPIAMGVPRATIEDHLDRAKSLYPAIAFVKDRTFEDWFRFLEWTGLAEKLESGLFKITNKGTAFLVYVDALKYSPKIF